MQGPTTIIFTFSDDVVAADGQLDSNEFAISNAAFGSASIAGNVLTLNLTNVVDQSVVQIALNGITGASGQPLVGDNDVEIRALTADANQDQTVDRGDIQLLRAHAGEPVSQSNYLLDLDLDGMIGAGDARLVRMNKLHMVP